jgi:Ferric reductase like transmembrane component
MYYRDTLRTKPRWLRVCLAVRKHVGVLSLWFMVVHIIGSVMFFNEAYLPKFFADPKAYSSKMNWMGEVSFSSAVWATGFYLIMGVCSLPSVAPAMTSRQFKFVFGPLAWIALLVVTLGHVVPQGCQSWDDRSKWYGNYPQITLTSTILPMFVIFFKIVQVLLWYVISACSKKKYSYSSDASIPLKESLSDSKSSDIEASE